MKRVTVKRIYATNELFKTFLLEIKEAETKKNPGSRLLFTYGHALKYLNNYPAEIKEAEELKPLKNFGDFIIAKLTKKLAEFRQEFGEPTDESLQRYNDFKSENLPDQNHQNLPDSPNKPNKSPPCTSSPKKKAKKDSTKKEYIPRTGSGSYAILRALYDAAIFNGDVEKGGLLLEDLRKAAEMYSNDAMVKSSAVQHYTPFSSLTKLTAEGLVRRKKDGRKDVVLLTDRGFALAKKLNDTEPDNEETECSNSEQCIKTMDGCKNDTKVKRKRNEPSLNSSSTRKKKKSKLTDVDEKCADVESIDTEINLQGSETVQEQFFNDDDDDVYFHNSLADRLNRRTVAQTSPHEELEDTPGPSWRGLVPSSSSETNVNFSVQPRNIVFLTSELAETDDISKAYRITDDDFGVTMVYIKTTENYLNSREDLLYKLSTNDGLFEAPYILAYLSEADAKRLTNDVIQKEQQSTIREFQQNDCFEEVSSSSVDNRKKNSSPSKDTCKFSLDREERKEFLDSFVVNDEIVLEPNTFDIVLIVDHAEIKGGVAMTGEKEGTNRKELLGDYLTQCGVLYEARKLNSGDYLWIARKRHCAADVPELVLDVIVERKRLDDLWSSILDGRWNSQKYRLKRCGLRKIMYLFEGLPNSVRIFSDSILSALRSAMINVEIQDGFYVEKTAHVKDTANFFARMTKLLIDNFKGKRLLCRNLMENVEIPEPDGLMDFDSNVVSLLSFNEFQKLAGKQRRFMIGEAFVMSLTQISGVSLIMAKAIGDKFGTFQGLLNAFDECGDNEKAKIKTLEDITTGAQGRRLGPSKAKQIVEFFCNQKSTV